MMFHFSSLGLGLPKHHKVLNKTKGFSLIELMVVLAIMAILMALTGGLATKNVSKRERVVELEKVAQIFQRLSYEAYYSGYDVHVNLNQNTLTKMSSGQTQVVTFEQLDFVRSEHIISTKAYVSPSQYRVVWQDGYRDFIIAPLFKTHQVYAPQN